MERDFPSAMANILILVQVFPPDNVATAQLYGDLAADLFSLGNRVTVLTTSPHYSKDSSVTRWQTPSAGLPAPARTTDHGGIRVCRIWMPKKRRNVAYRVGCWSWFHAASIVAGVFLRPRPEVILCPSPPPSIALAAFLLGKRFGAPFVYSVQEMYPDVAINLGAVRNKRLIRLLFQLERFTYANAAAVTAITRRMRTRLLEKGVPEEKVVLLPNFADTGLFHPMPRETPFAREHGLLDKFVVSYAGNMGKPQRLDGLLRVAGQLAGEPGIRFLLIGDGAERPALVHLAARLKLPNVSFLPYVSYSLMDQIYASSDLSYVPQAPGTSSDGMPSKVYRIMASGRPVLAATDPQSDLAQMLKDSGGGAAVDIGDEAAVAGAIQWAFQNREEWAKKGALARKHILDFYSRSRITGEYHNLLNRVAQGKPPSDP
jgi:colanic acid biosynthesis glycosyl transferase WcaI